MQLFTKTCERCGKPYESYRYRADESAFCSKQCQNNPARPEIKCERCGVSFQVAPSEGRGRRFCSFGCYKGRASKECAGCGKAFQVKPSMFDRQKYCGKECRARHGQTAWRGGRKESDFRRRARRKAAMRNTVVEPVTRADVLRVYGQGCYICGKGLADDEITIDHVVPVSKGGGHTLENLRPACVSCNCRKKDRPLSVFVCLLSPQ